MGWRAWRLLSLIAVVLGVAGVEGVVEVGVEGFPALAEFEVAVAEDDVAAAGFGVVLRLVGAVVGVGARVGIGLLVIVEVHKGGGAELAEVGGALDAVGLLAGLGKDGEKDGDQHGDDGDDDEELDQGKRPWAGPRWGVGGHSAAF